MLVPILLNKLTEDFEIEILRHVPAGLFWNDFQELLKLFKVIIVVNILHRFYYSNKIEKHKTKLATLIVQQHIQVINVV